METVRGGQGEKAGNVYDGALHGDTAFNSNALEIFGILLVKLEVDVRESQIEGRQTSGGHGVREGCN